MRLHALLFAAASLAAAFPAAAQPAPAPTAPAPPSYWVPPPAYYTPPPGPGAFGPGTSAAPGPWWRGPERVVTERRSTGMTIAGVTLFGVGAAGTIAGAGMFFFALANPCIVFDGVRDGGGPSPTPAAAGHEHIRATGQALSACDGLPEAGLLTMGVGAAVGLAGLPFFLYGISPVPRAADGGTGLAPLVRVGAGSASLRWTF